MKKVFYNDFTHTIDKQRRVAMPREWRDSKEENVFFLMPGRDNSIQALPEEIFMEDFYEKARKSSFANRQQRKALSEIGKFTHRTACDKQGRITLTPMLMDYSGLTDDAWLIGGITQIEIRKPEQTEESVGEIDAF